MSADSTYIAVILQVMKFLCDCSISNSCCKKITGMKLFSLIGLKFYCKSRKFVGNTFCGYLCFHLLKNTIGYG